MFDITEEKCWRYNTLYALPVVSISFLMGPLTIIQAIYAKYFGLALTSIATVLVTAKLFDAVTDPLIGYLSDRHFDNTGSRKSLIIAGGILFVISSWFLNVPPANVSTMYFLFWFLMFFLTHTIFEISHLAWASELAVDAQDKHRIYGSRALAIFVGSLLFFAVPLLPIFETSTFTPETLKWAVILAGCSMIPLLYVSMKKVPTGRHNKRNNRQQTEMHGKQRLVNVLNTILGNYPLLWFLSAFCCYGIGVGMWFSMVFLFIDGYLALGEFFALAYIGSFGICTLTLGVWSRLANYLGEKYVWNIAGSMIIAGIMGCGLLSPAGGEEMQLLVCMTLIYSGFGALTIIAPSLLADIIDYGTWKFGQERAGTYFAIYTLAVKANYAIGGAIGLGIAGLYGFDATSTSQSVKAIFGMKMVTAWLPVPMIILSMVLIRCIRINAKRHAIVRRRLDSNK